MVVVLDVRIRIVKLKLDSLFRRPLKLTSLRRNLKLACRPRRRLTHPMTAPVRFYQRRQEGLYLKLGVVLLRTAPLSQFV